MPKLSSRVKLALVLASLCASPAHAFRPLKPAEFVILACKARGGEARGGVVLLAGPHRAEAAEALAKGLDARLVSERFDDIGETEKNLSLRLEKAAGAVLFFDEADALFGKRTEVRDAHERFARALAAHPETLVVFGTQEASPASEVLSIAASSSTAEPPLAGLCGR